MLRGLSKRTGAASSDEAGASLSLGMEWQSLLLDPEMFSEYYSVNAERCHNRDLNIALAGRIISTFGDEVALVALTLRLPADGARPYEIGVLLAAGVIPLLLLSPSRPLGPTHTTLDVCS